MANPSQIIAAIDAQILAIITGGVASYSVPDLQITKLSLTQLRDMRREFEGIEAADSGELCNYVDMQ